MRLKKIRLAGFKSFVDPTNIPFPGDMTAIVGPNGCGKSNVIDAVRWVLGESSAKNLRGDAMTDVIFNGSNSRKAVSQCSVELVFDNSSGRIAGEYAAFNEISVKRLVTKEAVSSYFLNSSKCRRKDVTDLFLGTGLGPRSYAIIEQGMISKLIESKPQELRVFIEEAAGISKYKERRRETQNRINHTRENLDRLDDVRQGLGEQIAKLKRQAAAATKYTELKKLERKLKVELATVRWLAQSKLIQNAQDIINEKQLAVENLKASQDNDESGLQSFKNEQSIQKQDIDDIQKQIYTLGTDITKLEQSQLFAKKRSAQIQSEIEQIKLSENTLTDSLNALEVELAVSQEKLLEIEPEREIFEEQLFEIEGRKDTLESSLHSTQAQLKQLDKNYFAKNQALQQKHSQIQQTLSLQARTESRLLELTTQLSQIDNQALTEKLSQVKESIHESELSQSKHQSEYKAQQQTIANFNEEFNQSQISYQTSQTELTNVDAQLKALESLQAEFKMSESGGGITQVIKTEPLHTYFVIQKGYEKALHAVLKHLEPCVVVLSINNLTKHDIANLSEQYKSINLLFESNFTQSKIDTSFARLLTNEYIPSIFNQYLLAESLKSAIENQDSLTPNHYFIAPNGDVLSIDTLLYNQDQDNKFARAAKIQELLNIKRELAEVVENKKQKMDATKALLESAQFNYEQAKKELDLTVQNLQKLLLNQDNLAFQLAQFEDRYESIQSEITNQKNTLEQEKMSLELFNEQVEDLSIDVMSCEQEKLDFENKIEKLNNELQLAQTKQNEIQNKVHQQAMLVQQTRNTIQILQAQLKTKQEQRADNEEKLSLLDAEAEDLRMPEIDQQEKLQSLLAQQEMLRANMQTKQQKLADIEQEISLLEQGQQGFQIKMDKLKAEIDSQRIAQEGASVRAQSHVEQLAELNQSIKEVLEWLPEQNDEKALQAELEKTTSSIQRLGAVNLAAVQEFEEQSERKQHLDEQNLDLTEALTTLENAMRKIDRETRTRFKTTFEQINGDLKSLFPKVFGGGMAYLDLTDDDMLDTGVTIMARPPGKKNSTIQLLSGGEKALTALSLVFAIFRLNPAPFCLLDEVDAPLDDANVGRFCRLVSQMSESVQFIYITHNKVAMEMATHLTGVTMAEPGVSRMVAVDMEEALAIAE